MSFLYPTFLYALAAIAIPIIIHLFNFRRHKTVLFSSVKFLRNIKKETKAKSQLKHFLILLARILAVAALVFAFARPYLPVAGNVDTSSEEIVAVYIDNSFSMDAENKFGNMFEVAKSKIPQITEAFRPDTRYLLATNDFENKHNQFVSRDQLMDFVAELQLSPEDRNINDVLTKLSDYAGRSENSKINRQRAFILSDFQKTSCNPDGFDNRDGNEVILVPLATQQTSNMYVDSCWFESPGRRFNRAEELFAKIVNNSEEVYTHTPIKLFINDSLKFLGSFTIKARSEEVVKLSYTNSYKGIVSGRIEISDYPVTYDNLLYFSYKVAQQLSILSISDKGENKFVKALFGDDDYFEISQNAGNNINFSRFPSYHLIIISNLKDISSGLVQEIEKYVANGGSVLFFPSLDGNIGSYNQLFEKLACNEILALDTHKTKVSRIDFENPVFDDAFRKRDPKIDLPEVFAHFLFENRTRTNEVAILTTIDGHSFLSRSVYGKGSLYVSAVPLDNESSDFARHPIFVPAVYNMAFHSQGNTNLFYSIGNLENVQLNIQESQESELLHITGLSGQFDFIPEKQGGHSSFGLNLTGDINKAGNYLVQSGSQAIAGFSVNYNRKESNLDFYSNSELKDIIESRGLLSFSILEGQQQQITQSIKEFNQGRQLWKLFLMLALVFILVEVLLIRWMK